LCESIRLLRHSTLKKTKGEKKKKLRCWHYVTGKTNEKVGDAENRQQGRAESEGKRGRQRVSKKTKQQLGFKGHGMWGGGGGKKASREERKKKAECYMGRMLPTGRQGIRKRNSSGRI